MAESKDIKLVKASSKTSPTGQLSFHFTPNPKDRFRSVLKELVSLRDANAISDEQLEDLIVYACSFLIEQEVERRVTTILNKAASIDRIIKVIG